MTNEGRVESRSSQEKRAAATAAKLTDKELRSRADHWVERVQDLHKRLRHAQQWRAAYVAECDRRFPDGWEAPDA